MEGSSSSVQRYCRFSTLTLEMENETSEAPSSRGICRSERRVSGARSRCRVARTARDGERWVPDICSDRERAHRRAAPVKIDRVVPPASTEHVGEVEEHARAAGPSARFQGSGSSLPQSESAATIRAAERCPSRPQEGRDGT